MSTESSGACRRIILDLCGGTGSWSRPYADRPDLYDVRIVDPLDDFAGKQPWHRDVRLCRLSDLVAKGEQVHGILAAPPCTHFSGSGARWWAEKGDAALLDGLSVVDACMRIIHATRPVWWALENPVGRLRHYIGDPAFSFNPCDFAGWLGDGWRSDAYTKRTLVWGNCALPQHDAREAVDGSKLWKLPPSPDRWRLRSATPQGFARAFATANP